MLLQFWFLRVRLTFLLVRLDNSASKSKFDLITHEQRFRLQVVLVICDNEADVPAFASYKAAGAPAASAPAPSAAVAAKPPPPAAPKAAPAPAAPVAAPVASGEGLLKQMQQRQWAFSKQYGLPTPQNSYV